jgi:hypothetical protein
VELYLQSFFSDPMGFPVSVARFQPDGYKYDEIRILAPQDAFGSPINTLNTDVFLEMYCTILARNKDTILKVLNRLSVSDFDYTFCCWCSKERKRVSKVACHTILIGYFVELYGRDLDINIHYMDGREYPMWSKDKFKECMERQ